MIRAQPGTAQIVERVYDPKEQAMWVVVRSNETDVEWSGFIDSPAPQQRLIPRQRRQVDDDLLAALTATGTFTDVSEWSET